MTERLDIGKVFGRVFETYGAQAAVILPAALIVYLPVSILSGIAYDQGSALATLLAFVVGIVGSFWLQGVVVGAVADIQDERRDESLGSLFGKVGPVLGRLVLAGVLAAIGIGIGLLLLVVPGLILLTIWSLVIPVIVLERTGVLESFGRSRELVRGHAWRVFAIIVLLGIVQAILSSILRAVLSEAIGDFAGYALGDLVANVLVGSLSAIAVTVVYFELNRAKGRPLPVDPGDVFGARPATGAGGAGFTPPVSGAPERPIMPPDPPKE
jgi:MFS family permease